MPIEFANFLSVAYYRFFIATTTFNIIIFFQLVKSTTSIFGTPTYTFIAVESGIGRTSGNICTFARGRTHFGIVSIVFTHF